MEGSQAVVFNVPKKGILDKIQTNSYYRGERIKEDNGTQAARMQAGVDNIDILQDELMLAAADVIALITRNLGRCTFAESVLDPEEDVLPVNETEGEQTEGDKNDDSAEELSNAYYVFSVKAATNFPDDELNSSVVAAIASYMYDKALEGWMLINMPNEVQALGQRSVADAEKLKQLLIERCKPVR